jgi:hypothetical protein
VPDRESAISPVRYVYWKELRLDITRGVRAINELVDGSA